MGQEQVASTLTEAGGPRSRRDLVRHRRLHDVGSPACRGPREEAPGIDAKVYEALHIAAVFERADDFDVISNQFDFLPLSYSRLTSTPMVTTVHGFSSERIVPVYAAYDDIGHYVAISDANRHPALTYDATIYHGIDLDAFTLGDGDGGYLLFLGRIHPDKGASRWPGARRDPPADRGRGA